MNQLKTYHRPANVDEALRLLARPGVKTGVIGGGTCAVPHLSKTVDDVVDLQSIGLAELDLSGSSLTLGAMVHLQTISDDNRLPALLRQTAQQEGPNTLRQAATIGGVVVGAGKESELLAALLVFEATVQVRNSTGPKTISLADFLLDVPSALGGGLVTSIALTVTGQTAWARVARTPADSPIVAALARRSDNGDVCLALCGVANTPILVNPDNIEATVTPPGDFRGSTAYRRQMAVTLTRRVMAEVSQEN